MEQTTVTQIIADRVRRLRAQRRWSARQLADECARLGSTSLTRGTIAKIESDVRKSVTADEVAVLARALGVTPTLLTTPDSSDPEQPGRIEHHTIIVVDIESFADRAAGRQFAVREALYDLLRHAFTATGVEWNECRVEDYGDGAMILPPSDIPNDALVTELPQNLATALREYNSDRTADTTLRLRLAVHAGDIHFTTSGIGGEPVNLSFRLLDSPALRTALAASSGMLALIVSDSLYHEAVLPNPATEPGSYRAVIVSQQQENVVGWICLPDYRDSRKADPRGTADTAYLVIQIDPDPITTETYLLSHWRHLGPDWQPERGPDRIVSEVDLEPAVDQLIREAEDHWAGSSASIQLEFVLPTELLNLPVDQWLDDEDPHVPLGLRYPVVVRSLERIRTPRLHRRWRRRWDNLRPDMEPLLLSVTNEPTDLVRLAATLAADDNASVVAFRPPPEPADERRDILASLRDGTPIVIWNRGRATPDEFEAAVRRLASSGVEGIPEGLRSLRAEAYASDDPSSHIGSHIALLWDDPTRVPA
jgi:transcriptional regulator with XRE-family HTH domain